MRLAEFADLVSQKRKELSKDKIESELKKTLNELYELRNSLEKIKEIKGKMLVCADDILEEKSKILKSDDPEYVSKMINILYDKVISCYDRIEENKRRQREEQINKIKEINNKLLIYKKIFKNIFGENVEINLLNDNVEDLSNEIKTGEEQIDRLYSLLKSLAGENLELLIYLVEKNEVEINDQNYIKILDLIEFLVSKGITLTLRFSK